MISAEQYNKDYEVARKFGYEQGKAGAIEFIVKYIIFPLLNEYDIGLWEDIEYIELADKWVEFKKRYKADDDSIIKELEKWIVEKLKERK